ncbi:MAG: hypothetical protein M1828_005528 [Chrysothrix sp. TS-e1954]|nr:MAG: hypothetical protein M1828_005528 [Chrysothrix sp. TS-e1954]
MQFYLHNIVKSLIVSLLLTGFVAATPHPQTTLSFADVLKPQGPFRDNRFLKTHKKEGYYTNNEAASPKTVIAKPMTAMALYSEIDKQWHIIRSALTKTVNGTAVNEEAKLNDSDLDQRVKLLRLNIGSLVSLYTETMDHYQSDFLGCLGDETGFQSAMQHRFDKLDEVAGQVQAMIEDLEL